MVDVGITNTKERVCQLDFNISKLTRLIPSEGRTDEDAERQAGQYLDGLRRAAGASRCTACSAPRPSVGVPPSFVSGRDLPESEQAKLIDGSSALY